MANEKRLIDIGKRMDEWNELLKAHYPNMPCQTLYEFLLNAPTVDAVEVVRCKDCAFCKVDNSVYMRDVFGNENDTPRYHCLMGYGYNKPDHFCSYGERRKD